ncbi:MAG: sulfite exporter TauE/SafE family protein [Planctomycetota bacterium]
MDLSAILITVAAGIAMGAINNVAGGAGVLGLLAFEHACGLPLSVANPSTRPAALAIGLFSFLGYLRAGKRPPARVWLGSLAAIPGAIVGTRLALELPDLVFRGYLAAIMVALLVQMLRPRRSGPERPPRPWLAPIGCFLIGVHLGYVQIGTGLLAILVFTTAYSRDLVSVSAAKSTTVILASLTSVHGFWTSDAIRWEPGLWLALGTAIGAFQASRWAVAKGTAVLRRIVVAIAVLTLVDQLVHIAQLLR